MFLTENYKNRLLELAGLKIIDNNSLLEEAINLYSNSNKRVKFDLNIMKQAIEGGLEIGMIFQSNNVKYKMPIWKTRIVQPVAMGYDKKGQLVIRGIHIEGQSEKKAIETGIRSAQAKNEWRLFKASNIKSMFFTGRMFNKLILTGYNPKDSAMLKIIKSFDAGKAAEFQKQMKISKINIAKQNPIKPVVNSKIQTSNKSNPKEKENMRKLTQKINKLNKLK